MTDKRKIEIFSAGCAVCDGTVARVREIACASCDVRVLDMHDDHVAERAAELGVTSVPAVVIDGKLAACCAGNRIDESALRAAGLGQPLS